jgi:hypothetical protein
MPQKLRKTACNQQVDALLHAMRGQVSDDNA